MIKQSFTVPSSFTYGAKSRVLMSLNQFLMDMKGSKVKKSPYWPSRAKKDLMTIVREIANNQLSPVQTYPVDVVIAVVRDSNRATDMGNYSIVEKFATDALVQAGIFTDDSWKYIRSVKMVDGGLNPTNPHCVYTIIEPERKKRARE